jgi:polysaccharide export outer membrane protein
MTKHLFRFLPGLIGIWLVFLLGCGSERMTRNDIISWTAERKKQNVESDQYVILKGDRVEINVAGYPEFNVTVAVKEDGTMTIPLVGEVPAAGLTRADLTGQIISRLSDYVKNKVVPTIKIKGALDQKLIVLGSVTTQGTYPATASISPFQALALAGGPTPTADLRHIRVFRGGVTDATIELDLSATLAALPGRADELPFVYPGDLIYVPREENVIRDFADLLRDVIVLFGIFAIVR